MHHEYLYGIDLLRFSAALAVAVFHFTWHDPTEYRTAFFGWIGVEVFFVISGIVIANSADGTGYLTFLRGRILRLYPAAIACALIGSLLLWSRLGGQGMSIGNAVRSATLWIHKPWVNGAYWTLPVEMSFYALIFILLVVDRFRYIGALACALTIIPIPFLICLYAHTLGLLWMPDLDYDYGTFNLSLLHHGQYFALGIFIFLFRQGRGTSLYAGFFAVGLLDGALEILIESMHVRPRYGALISLPSLYLTCVTIWLCSVGLLMLASFHSEHFPSKGGTRFIVRKLGLMTYPLYLVHMNVGDRVIAEISGVGLPRWIAVMIALLSSIIIAFIISMFIEPVFRAVMKYCMGLSRSSQPTG